MKAVGGRAVGDKTEARGRSQSQVQVIARAASILRALEDEAAGSEPRPDRAAREPGAFDGAAHRRRARSGEIPDCRLAERPGAARTDHPAARRLGAHGFRRRGAALSHAAVERAQGDRRSLGGQEGSPGVHRSGDRFAAAAHGVRGRRDVSALLHRERQGVSRRSRRRRDRTPHRHELRAAHAAHADAARPICCGISRAYARPASPSTARSMRSASAPPGVVTRDPVGNLVAISVPVPAQRFYKHQRQIVARLRATKEALERHLLADAA